jgi:hypothetical protein
MLLTNIKELGLMWKNASQAYRGFTDGGADAVGKKERQDETAAELSTTGRFQTWRLPPKLVATDGRPV